MFKNRNIVCSIEIGTSKICVLVGEVSADGTVEVIGKGETPSAGTVVKGEICNYPAFLPLLEKAVDEADRSAGGCVGRTRLLHILAQVRNKLFIISGDTESDIIQTGNLIEFQEFKICLHLRIV